MYMRRHEMLTQLRSAAGTDATHDRKLLRFTSPDLLIVDNLVLRPLVHEEPISLAALRCRSGHADRHTGGRDQAHGPDQFGRLLRSPRRPRALPALPVDNSDQF